MSQIKSTLALALTALILAAAPVEAKKVIFKEYPNGGFQVSYPNSTVNRTNGSTAPKPPLPLPLPLRGQPEKATVKGCQRYFVGNRTIDNCF